jgi:hypothetical protein
VVLKMLDPWCACGRNGYVGLSRSKLCLLYDDMMNGAKSCSKMGLSVKDIC